MSKKERYVPYMRPVDVLRELEKTPIIYFPIGSIEWHNEHLPLGTDTLHAREICMRLADEIGGIVMPEYWWNTGSCHRHKVTYYLEEDKYEECLKKICMGFQDMPCKLLVLVNGHGGDHQKEIINSVEKELNKKKLEYKVVAVDPYHITKSEYMIDHADRIETSLSMELIPDLVQMDKEIQPDIISKELPFKEGLPNRKIGYNLWNTFLNEAVAFIKKEIGEMREI